MDEEASTWVESTFDMTIVTVSVDGNRYSNCGTVYATMELLVGPESLPLNTDPTTYIQQLDANSPTITVNA